MSAMTTLVAGLYSQFETTVNPSFEGTSPAIISLFETFWDERFEKYRVSYHARPSRYREAQRAQENTCLIDFQRWECREKPSNPIT